MSILSWDRSSGTFVARVVMSTFQYLVLQFELLGMFILHSNEGLIARAVFCKEEEILGVGFFCLSVGLFARVVLEFELIVRMQDCLLK